VCGTKNFASVRLYSAPQLHWTIVAILGICAYGTPKQAESAATIKLIHDRRLGAKPDESSASDGHLGIQCLQSSKASVRCAIGTADTRRSEPRPPA
jgi:hypothetical protein